MTRVRDLPAAGSTRKWRVGSREIVMDHPIVMGILNVTPDSFSDGGNFFSPDSAIAHAEKMIADGADILDVGGESTRPGAVPVEAVQEADRVVPVITALRQRWPEMHISIDTTKADVAAAALDAGANIINDVSAMRLDPEMASLAGRTGAGVVLMHSRGTVADMATYDHAHYDDVVREVMSELNSQMLLAEEAGVDRKSIVVDPGFGFSKRSQHSVQLLHSLRRFEAFDTPIMVGVSRKRFVREAMLNSVSMPSLDDRDSGSAAVNVMALERGAMIFRAHNVRATRNALETAWSILQMH
ncbi:MAG TPA: dihydropteroate synthase [Gemmatimonadaceae bacterium]